MTNKRFGALTSSVDPNKLAATVSGVLKVVGSLVAFLALTGLINAADSMELVKQLETLLTATVAFVTAAYGTYGAAQAVFGTVRKILIHFATARPDEGIVVNPEG